MKVNLEVDDLTDDQQDRMCSLCSDCFFNGSVNTNQHNLCEGSRCGDAIGLLEEELQVEMDEKYRYMLLLR